MANGNTTTPNARVAQPTDAAQGLAPGARPARLVAMRDILQGEEVEWRYDADSLRTQVPAL